MIGLLGGTFDPVHLGHIQMALEAKQCLNLAEVRLMPCHQPPHREQPQLTSEQRVCLLQLAIEGIDGLSIDDREMRREGPSYTVDTLKDLRKELGPDVSIVLLMGADAYASLTQWHRWQELLKLAHIGVFLRPGFVLPASGILSDLLNDSDVSDIEKKVAGSVVALNQKQVDISATEIRRQLAAEEVPSQLAQNVYEYIINNQLYKSRENVVNDN
ncbi:MAG: nicotinate-nucleotide adenylyltransferase [Cellvibrionaceae bacterium]